MMTPLSSALARTVRGFPSSRLSRLWRKGRTTLGALILAAAAAQGCLLAAPGAPYDIVIKGGTVVDGTGRAPHRVDVAIADDRIVYVGALVGGTARETIDATGLVVAPGFIDVHNHADTALVEPSRKLNEGFVRQGVTTVVGGPDGSASPRRIRDMVAAYDRQGVGTNVAFYVGHNAIRQEVMAVPRAAPTSAELERMKALVRDGMTLGALGFSTGLMYEPGLFSSTDEVVELTREVRAFGGIYDSHVRDPAHALLGSDREAIDIGERAGVPVKIAHEKAVGLENVGLIKDVVSLVESARRRGLNVVTDQYPYDGAATGPLTDLIVVPPALAAAPAFDLRAALRLPQTRLELQVASEQGLNGGFAWLKATGYSHMRITTSPDAPELVGRYLSQLAAERRMTGFDLVADLILQPGAPIGVTFGAIDEDDVQLLLVQPWNMIASDGEDVAPTGTGGHPRSTGTFPRVLGHYVREKRLLSLEEAVRKMTSFPADFVGLTGRGRLVAGKAADITVFDPTRIIDRSSYASPRRYADGVRHVLVNGRFVLRDGAMTGAAPGRFLPRER
ncbi:MAG: D-aminoacylase [Vicinamibacterales bacterium]